MNEVFQGDQYYIEFAIKTDGVPVSPESIDQITISVGGNEQSFPDGKLTYSQDGIWLYYLSASASSRMAGKTPCQVALYSGGVIQHSCVFSIDVQKSIIGGIGNNAHRR